MFNDDYQQFKSTLETRANDYDVALKSDALDQFVAYYQLLRVWNPRLHLVAPTSPQEFATRHILESLSLLDYLPLDARVADIGSGGGLPIIPCLIARPGMHVMLIESSKKKAVFLREALTLVESVADAIVVGERFENVVAPDVGFVTCRALERFAAITPKLIDWAPANAVFLFFGGEGLREPMTRAGLEFTAKLMPSSEKRFLYVGNK